jgi:DNA-binding transcriptional regulator YdaS (Cro superfamily)
MKKACEVVGNLATLARQLGLKPPSVFPWVSGKQQVPAARCPTIERLTGGVVRCEELRPDVEWGYLRGTEKDKQ